VKAAVLKYIIIILLWIPNGCPSIIYCTPVCDVRTNAMYTSTKIKNERKKKKVGTYCNNIIIYLPTVNKQGPCVNLHCDGTKNMKIRYS